MTAQTAPAPWRVRDSLPLPAADARLTGAATRTERYRIHVVAGAEEAAATVVGILDGAAAALITDETVEALYGLAFVNRLRDAGVDVLVHAVPAGESSKSLHRAVGLWDSLARSRVSRRDVVVNLGGGVIADLGGWVASGYMRGLPYVNVPTTLLAQVDGALGGKVAVNHPLAKNLLGAFHQPVAVVTAIGFLASVDRRHIRAGLAESIKKGVIASPEYFAFIESSADALLGREPAALERLVRGAAAIKCSLVERDPYEEDLRRPLNFGHTVGHPLETVTGYGPLLHGEVVAFGMAVEARIAAARGLLDEGTLERLLQLLRRCGLPTTRADLRAEVHAGEVLAAMEKVRLIRAGSLRWVLPVRLGETEIADDVSDQEVRAALAACGLTV